MNTARLSAHTGTGSLAGSREATIRNGVERFLSELRRSLSFNREPIINANNHRHLDILIARENAHTPGLNVRLLAHANNPLAKVADEIRSMHPLPGFQWQALIYSGGRYTTASVRHAADDPTRVSTFLLDSLPNARNDTFINTKRMQAFLDREGFSVKFVVASSGVQNAGPVFSLSAAKIIANSPQIDSIHRQMLQPGSEPAHREPVRLANASNFPSEFFKYAMPRAFGDLYFPNKAVSAILQPINQIEYALRERLNANPTSRISMDKEGGADYDHN